MSAVEDVMESWVPRYTIHTPPHGCGVMELTPYGQYVKHQDYVELKLKYDALVRQEILTTGGELP